MKIFIYPGSFDPLTKGHMDIALRASALCDKLLFAVLQNQAKNSYFSLDERVEMAKLCFTAYPNIEVKAFSGLLVDMMREENANSIVRGIRSESDFRYELELMMTNKLLYPNYETLLLPARQDYAFISSSMVREISSYGGVIKDMVPECLQAIIENRLKNTRKN